MVGSGARTLASVVGYARYCNRVAFRRMGHVAACWIRRKATVFSIGMV